ncbi:MAG: hypothetical protein Kow0037_27400 [Calditrichia bacterium]
MKFKNTIILFIVLVLLSGYVYFFEIKKSEETEKMREVARQVIDFPQDSVETIIFKNNYGKFVIKKLQGEWRITEPLYTEADENTINAMLRSICEVKRDTVYETIAADLPYFGLGEEALWVVLETFGGQRDSIRMGDKSPVGPTVYSARSDTLVFTIPSMVKNQFNKKLYDIRDKKLLHFERDDIQSVTVKNKFGTYEFVKTGNNEWEIPSLKRPAENSKISSIISKLQYNNAKEFVDETGKELKNYGLTHPAFWVQLNLGKEKGTRKLLISRKKDGKYYGKDEARKPIFVVDSALVNDINKQLKEFRSTDLAKFDRVEIDSMRISYNDTTVVLAKDTTNTWVMPDSANARVKYSNVTTVFNRLDYSVIKEFVTDGPFNPAHYGLDKPQVEVSLYKDGQLELNVKFGKERNGNVYVTTNRYESVYLIPKTQLAGIKLKPGQIIEKDTTEKN